MASAGWQVLMAIDSPRGPADFHFLDPVVVP
jgi:hypothetical protein